MICNCGEDIDPDALNSGTGYACGAARKPHAKSAKAGR